MGVYLAYVKNGIRLLIDCRLYLTKSWCYDPERCKCSGIPQSEQAFRTKGELALEMIVDAIRAGHRFTHVCMDGFYGSQPGVFVGSRLNSACPDFPSRMIESSVGSSSD